MVSVANPQKTAICAMQWEFATNWDAIKHYRTCPEVKREP